jgi:primosomal protein N' (replication factor Y)
MQALKRHDSRAFYQAEIEARADAALPPFGRLASIVVSAPAKADAEAHARALARIFPELPQARLLGPAEAPIGVIRGRHRIRLIVRADRSADLSGIVRDWLACAPKAATAIGVQIDVDPISFL